MSQLSEIVNNNAVGCLCMSTLNSTPSGVMVFYAVKNEKLFIITQNDSLKPQDIHDNPNVCFVVADPINYRQAQLQCAAKIVSNPSEYVPLLGEVIAKYSQGSHNAVAPTNVWTGVTDPLVIQLTPTS